MTGAGDRSFDSIMSRGVLLKKGMTKLEKALSLAVLVLGVALLVVTILYALHDHGSDDDDDDSGASVGDGGGAAKSARAICVLRPDTEEEPNITGYVAFEQTEGGDVRVSVNITGIVAAPATRGLHVHTHGDVTTCALTGGHYNPDGVVHGGPEDETRHPGDFGNMPVVNQAIVRTFTDPRATLFGERSIIGRAVVLHGGRDDLGRGAGAAAPGSRASGNAGPRRACCVVGRRP